MDRAGALTGRTRSAVLVVAFLAAYVALAAWAEAFAATRDGSLSIWYPPPGLVLVVLHRKGLWLWPVAAAGELLASVAVYQVADEFGPLLLVLNAAGITAAYALGAAILRHAAPAGRPVRRADIAWFVLATFLVAAPLAALVGVGIQAAADLALDGGFWRAVGTWWLGDAIGLLVIAPVGYAVTRYRGSVGRWVGEVLPRAGIFEVCEVVAVVAMPVAVFVVGDDPYRVLYLLLLPVVLVAVRHGWGPASFAVLGSVLATTVAADATEAGTIGRTELQLLLLTLAFTGNAVGVVERLRQLATVRAAELAALVDSSPDLVAIVDDTNAVRFLNPAGQALLGVHGDALPPTLDGALDPAAVAAALHAGSWQGTVRLEANGATHHLSELAVRLPPELGPRVGLVARDVTDLHRLNDQLTHLTFTDELTGLANRARLFERLAFALERAHAGVLQGVLLLDLDRFSSLNDHHGHDVGDAVLRGVADRLNRVVRSGELLARIGDDRFAVFLEDVHDELAAITIAERLRAAAEGAPHERTPGAEVLAPNELTVSAGIVVGEAGDEPDLLLRRADLALQQAKAAGGACTLAYDTTLSDRLSERIRIEALLRDALDGDGWPLRYQPVVELATGVIVGCEALLEPIVPPLEVVGVAEEIGLIGRLGEQVLNTAVDQAVAWRERVPDLVMGVNVSALQLIEPVLPSRVKAALERSGLPGSALVLEVTETAFADDTPQAARAAVVLKSLGVQLSIDDFGTGFSSLGRLRLLPADELKVDRTFVADLGQVNGAESIVAAVVALGAARGLSVVAEGVEEEHQRRQLVELGCRLGQGWLFARPMAPPDFERWLDVHLAAAPGAGAPSAEARTR